MRVFVDTSLIIYLNVRLPDEEARKIEDFWLKLLEESLYTDILVLDEAIYVSKRKYGVPVEETLELIDKAILPYVEILPLS
ncbi:MAG TPA: type II toxin-antitoxin system VapC family toxin, partial [Desulfurococcaceae archaeon]|nr:type II toxin-antitoxin system VapC family toxin [Desulfurococcaceae archaeon]